MIKKKILEVESMNNSAIQSKTKKLFGHSLPTWTDDGLLFHEGSHWQGGDWPATAEQRKAGKTGTYTGLVLWIMAISDALKNLTAPLNHRHWQTKLHRKTELARGILAEKKIKPTVSELESEIEKIKLTPDQLAECGQRCDDQAARFDSLTATIDPPTTNTDEIRARILASPRLVLAGCKLGLWEFPQAGVLPPGATSARI